MHFVHLLAPLAPLAAAVGTGFALSGPRWRGPVSDHFDGDKFFNPHQTQKRDFRDLAKWMAAPKNRGEWKRDLSVPPGPKPPERVDDLRVTFVNHATVLVQMNGVNLLTDPVWAERVSPFSFAGPKRYRAAGLRLEDLPPIDVVLISHNHYDHLDVETLKVLVAKHRPRIVTGLGNVALLNALGITGAVELDWWQTTDVPGGLKIHCAPAQHFSNRGMFDRDATLWCGFVIEGRAGKVFFCGDSGYGRHFADVGERLGPMRLALLPIGAYRPEWFMGPVHMNPAEAVKAHKDVKAAISLGIHHGTFRLTEEGQEEPVRDLEAALAKEPVRPEFWVLREGEGRDVPALATAETAAATTS